MSPTNYKVQKVTRRRGLWPFYGLLMAVALGAISYILSPQLVLFVRRQSPEFSIGDLTPDQVRLFFAGVIFLVLLSVVTLILAVAAPRKKSDVKDRHLLKEKQAMEAARRTRRKRQLQVERKMRQQNKRLE
jgi:type VI protein secretion system component VasK